jgi:ABC-type transporter Mla MlaB component
LEEAKMLRITRIEMAEGGPLIKLEGKLLGPWVEEVSQACAMPDPSAQRPRLDLAAVSYADTAGIALLRKLRDQEVTIVACSGYVAELLYGITP